MKARVAALLIVVGATMPAAEPARSDDGRMADAVALLARFDAARKAEDRDALRGCYDFHEAAKLAIAKMQTPIEWTATQRAEAVDRFEAAIESGWADASQRRDDPGRAAFAPTLLVGPLAHYRDEFWSAEERVSKDDATTRTVWFAETATGLKLLMTPVQAPPPVGQPRPVAGKP